MQIPSIGIALLFLVTTAATAVQAQMPDELLDLGCASADPTVSEISEAQCRRFDDDELFRREDCSCPDGGILVDLAPPPAAIPPPGGGGGPPRFTPG